LLICYTNTLAALTLSRKQASKQSPVARCYNLDLHINCESWAIQQQRLTTSSLYSFLARHQQQQQQKEEEETATSKAYEQQQLQRAKV